MCLRHYMHINESNGHVASPKMKKQREKQNSLKSIFVFFYDSCFSLLLLIEIKRRKFPLTFSLLITIPSVLQWPITIFSYQNLKRIDHIHIHVHNWKSAAIIPPANHSLMYIFLWKCRRWSNNCLHA